MPEIDLHNANAMHNSVTLCQADGDDTEEQEEKKQAESHGSRW